MGALALADEGSGDLVLARDPRGIKPLVRTTGDRFAFASDAMALVRAGLSSGAIDPDAIEEFTAFHYVPPPLTGLAGLPCGLQSALRLVGSVHSVLGQ